MKCFITHQDCIYEKDIQLSLNSSKRSLFMISPFRYPYDEIFKNVIEPAGEQSDITVWRADCAFQLGFVMCTKICKSMQQATYVMADLTEDNPNVYYELGLAWGFGKKIVVMRDMDVPCSDHFREVLGTLEQKILSYETPQEGQTQPPREEFARRGEPAEGGKPDIQCGPGSNPERRIFTYKDLRELWRRLGRKETVKLVELIEDKAIDVQKRFNMDRHRAKGAYIWDKKIGVCYRAGRPDTKFYMGMAQEATIEMTENNGQRTEEARNRGNGSKEVPRDNTRSRRWALVQIPVGNDLLGDSLPRRFASSKAIIVDVTHYRKKPDTSIYFALGLSHAMGRETIPITNTARYMGTSPFDVRGLWQVYFKTLDELQTGLVGILKDVISREYEDERRDYPLRSIWDKVLERQGGLSVISCSRGAKSEDDRPGGRTHVDKWDYASVAKLASFLGEKYKHAANIKPPEEKAKMDESQGASGRNILMDKIEKDLRDDPNNIIIVGSPDVNDYAEIVLARIYGIDPYQPQKCKRPTDDPEWEQCWSCKRPDNGACISKRGYLFYKKTIEKDHPRKSSSFFRNPSHNDPNCVLWYGAHIECIDAPSGSPPAGQTYGVLTLFKDRRDLFGRDDRWIIVLSGFTGIATYELAKMLTTTEVTMKEDKTLLYEALEASVPDLASGVQVLVFVDYGPDSKGYDSRHKFDSRHTKESAILHISSQLMDKERFSANSPENTAGIEPFSARQIPPDAWNYEDQNDRSG